MLRRKGTAAADCPTRRRSGCLHSTAGPGRGPSGARLPQTPDGCITTGLLRRQRAGQAALRRRWPRKVAATLACPGAAIACNVVGVARRRVLCLCARDNPAPRYRPETEGPWNPSLRLAGQPAAWRAARDGVRCCHVVGVRRRVLCLCATDTIQRRLPAGDGGPAGTRPSVSRRSPRLRVVPRRHHEVRADGAAVGTAKPQLGQRHVAAGRAARAHAGRRPPGGGTSCRTPARGRSGCAARCAVWAGRLRAGACRCGSSRTQRGSWRRLAVSQGTPSRDASAASASGSVMDGCNLWGTTRRQGR